MLGRFSRSPGTGASTRTPSGRRSRRSGRWISWARPWSPRSRTKLTGWAGGVEDPRVTYVRPLGLFVMTYTAFLPPHHPRIALAVSSDLLTWERLGPLHYAMEHGTPDLNRCGNKDGVLFSDLVQDPLGRPALALLHRPTYSVRPSLTGAIVTPPPGGTETEEYLRLIATPRRQGDRPRWTGRSCAVYVRPRTRSAACARA